MAGRGHGSRREHVGDRLIAALLASGSPATAARETGLGERTVRRWLGDPVFRDRYRAARREVLEAAVARLQGLTLGAVEAFRAQPQA